MQKVGAILSLATVLVAGSMLGQHSCKQVSGAETSANNSEPNFIRVCAAYSERLDGLLAHVECIPDCGMDYSYYLSRDHGETWMGVSDPDLDEGETNVRTFGSGLTQDRVRYRTVASGQGERKQWLLERSNNKGKSWAKRRAIWAETGLKISSFVDVYHDSANPEILYATVRLGTLGDRWQLFMSKDGGHTFGLLVRDVYDFAVSRTNPRVIYATTFVNRILKSIDNGLTWSEIGQASFSIGRHGNEKKTGYIEIQVDPSNSERVFVLSSNGLHRSEDGGVTWSRVDLGIAGHYEACNFLIDPQNAKKMFLGTYDRGLFKSDDGGRNWEAVDLTGKAKR